uniref:PPM-type phosphatase domain-containing protein n=1 Tax=Erythrolobus australicus TaxID=1077150 RepID=A0A7S1XHN3_9RHOD
MRSLRRAFGIADKATEAAAAPSTQSAEGAPSGSLSPNAISENVPPPPPSSATAAAEAEKLAMNDSAEENSAGGAREDAQGDGNAAQPGRSGAPDVQGVRGGVRKEGIASESYCAVQAVGFTDDANPRFRPSMEDGHIILDEFRGRENEAFFGVYDGHGGRAAVEIVVSALHAAFERELERGHPVERAFFEAYSSVDALLEEQKCYLVGTTSVTCYVCVDADGKRVLYTANVGDARAVLCYENGRVQRLSYDHKADDAAELRRISDSGGFVAAKRVNGVLAVSRALGDHALKNVVICAPHVTKQPLEEEGLVLVLACDGLWDVVSDEEIAKLLNDKRRARALDAHQMSKKLVKTALERGSTDNISVLCVRLS